MPSFADLEIGLHRRDADSYAVDLRFTPLDSEAEIRLLDKSPIMSFDVKTLRQYDLNDTKYGQTLAAALFGAKGIQDAFKEARQSAQQADAALRVRLFIGPSAPELHSLRWETLRDPQFDSPLLTNEQIIFSRYLSSLDWRPVRLRAQAELKALVVIANPANLDPTQLAPLDVAGEQARAEAGLGDIKTTVLASGGQATLTNMARHLRDEYDILYLVCHGALDPDRGEPKLWLEDETGKSRFIFGNDLITCLRELSERPRLVVLASCQSAGSGNQARTNDSGALSALGPLLARAGIPAVLAMQGNISMNTVEQFMPEFFRELRRDGQIDRAMAAARGGVRDRRDWWMPVLFMRLMSGQVWYTPGFADDDGEPDRWPALIDCIQNQECTPILGPGLTENMFGSRQELAGQLAETHHFPMAPYDREDLPRVGQYLAVIMNASKFLPRTVLKHLYQQVISRFGDKLPRPLNQLAANDDLVEEELIDILGQLTEAVGQFQQADSATAPHHVLARLPFRIYITTDPTDTLSQALKAAGKAPVVEVCRWNRFAEQLPSIYDETPNYRPTIDTPLVYHLFGHIKEPRSLVLTEDNYFDYLIGATSNKKLIPAAIKGRLVDAALLFLGFQMDDWNFRVLFRSIIGQQGSDRIEDYPSISAQVTPEEGRIISPKRARKYLETYFQKSGAITIFWGSTQDFITELYHRWNWEET